MIAYSNTGTVAIFIKKMQAVASPFTALLLHGLILLGQKPGRVLKWDNTVHIHRH